MSTLGSASDALILYGEKEMEGWGWPFVLNNESSDVSVGASLAMSLGFFVLCLAVVGWIFKTGYRLKS